MPDTPSSPSPPAAPPGTTTGRYIITFREGAQEQALALMSRSAGIGLVASAADFAGGAVDPDQVSDAGAVYFDKLGVAVVSTPPDALQALSVAAAGDDQSAILAIEPEWIMAAIVDGDATAELFGGGSALADSAAATWGLAATKVIASQFSGQGIRVAVLDTGLDLRHPDFAGRQVTSQSFVPGQEVQDLHGHGTHCIGTACGARQPATGRRYGIAWQAQIYAGKVLGNDGRGPDGGILAGLNWAVTNGCRIVSMSLGVQGPPSVAYEQVAQRALAAGTLIVAAAGNDSQRSQNRILPVSRAANSPSILAVAAVDSSFQVADFSNRGIVADGGQVDIAGPGVDVYSAAPMPTRNRVLSGTSMATPHVAGIAALWAEARQVTGTALFQVVAGAARSLGALSVDVGAGLVQAP
jgi:subtilisin family serine protease